MRYMPEAVVHEWCDVIKMLESGMADKVIVARRDHAEWLEVVSEEGTRADDADTRRPHGRQ
jgi:hypothetical protein